MAGAGEEGEKRERVGSLGWITESSVMPKKHKAIEGVGAASIVELKAQLYRTQEEARNAKAADSASDSSNFHRARQRPLPSDLFSQKNSGVEVRAKRDKLEMKAEKDGSASYAALERKAELYEKLTRGELPDEEEKEKYCVDFFRKGLEQCEPQESESCDPTNDEHLSNENGDSDNSLPSAKASGLGRTGAALDKDEHKRFVREVHEEVDAARQKAATLKVRRQEQEATRRERLRQAYLKKQLEKLISAKQGAPAEASSQ